MSTREVEDGKGVRWTCVQAYAGLERDAAEGSAAEVGDTGRFRVVCTPSGGSRSVELELPRDWEESCSDEALLGLIDKHQD